MADIEENQTQNPTLSDSVNCAVEGFMYVIRTQRNMRFHFLCATAVVLLGIVLNLSKIELLLVCVSVAFILMAEMFNTAVERTVDLISDKFHPLARIVKDITAGAVLIAAINALFVGYLVFLKPILNVDLRQVFIDLEDSSWHITLVILILTIALVILIKGIFHRGTPMRGGMPSGHAAVAFSLWTIISFISKETLTSGLALLMAVLISRSRIRKSIHSFWEVLAGASLGVFITVLIFQIFRR